MCVTENLIMKVALVLITMMLACQARSEITSRKVMDAAFSDFVFVGSGKAKFRADGVLDITHAVEHGDKEQSKPDKLTTGIEYVFHHNGAVDDERLGGTEIPSRLSKIGVKILEAPNYNGGTFSYPYIGGPCFVIRFSDGHNEGLIFNQISPKTDEQGRVVEDYVLVYLP